MYINPQIKYSYYNSVPKKEDFFFSRFLIKKKSSFLKEFEDLTINRVTKVRNVFYSEKPAIKVIFIAQKLN